MPTLNVTLSDLTIREKIEFARRLAEAVPAHEEHFPAPPHPRVEVEAALRDLEIAYDAARLAGIMSRRKDELLSDAESVLDSVLRKQIDYIEAASRGEVSLLRDMGLGSRVATSAKTSNDASGSNEQWW